MKFKVQQLGQGYKRHNHTRSHTDGHPMQSIHGRIGSGRMLARGHMPERVYRVAESGTPFAESSPTPRHETVQPIT